MGFEPMGPLSTPTGFRNQRNKPDSANPPEDVGGGRGIRTLAGFYTPTRFPSEPLQPLGYPTVLKRKSCTFSQYLIVTVITDHFCHVTIKTLPSRNDFPVTDAAVLVLFAPRTMRDLNRITKNYSIWNLHRNCYYSLGTKKSSLINLRS